LAEFTGERVIPGLADEDLLNEHLSRYHFALRYCGGKTVLDAGSGAGYGSALLATEAESVTGIDISAEAVAQAQTEYPVPNLQFQQASAVELPFRPESFDVTVAFEVIEHLLDWHAFIREAARILAPGGILLVSTPNRRYYAEARGGAGPNPYHVHEFDHAEFLRELRAIFPQIRLFTQNHSEAILFQPQESGWPAGAQVNAETLDPENSHYLLAICSREPLPASGPFVYVPSTANLLRERGLHIRKLESEILQKDRWLEAAQTAQSALLEEFQRQTGLLDQSNRWAMSLDAELGAARQRISELQQELQEKISWAHNIQRELDRCAGLLEKAEATVVERTEWAQRLDERLAAIQGTRWHRLGVRLKVDSGKLE
jgi:SAM-dependent methyltransferase